MLANKPKISHSDSESDESVCCIDYAEMANTINQTETMLFLSKNLTMTIINVLTFVQNNYVKHKPIKSFISTLLGIYCYSKEREKRKKNEEKKTREQKKILADVCTKRIS